MDERASYSACPSTRFLRNHRVTLSCPECRDIPEAPGEGERERFQPSLRTWPLLFPGFLLVCLGFRAQAEIWEKVEALAAWKFDWEHTMLFSDGSCALPPFLSFLLSVVTGIPSRDFLCECVLAV